MVDHSALSDLELLRLCGEGNTFAENALILRYRRFVRACTRPYFLAGGDSEDLIQEGMIGLLSAIRKYDANAGVSFHSYAELCVRRRVISAAKSASRLKHSPLNDGVSLDEILSDEIQSASCFPGRFFDRSPEEQVLAREQANECISIYSRYLSSFETEILGYYLDGLSYEEIAVQVNRSVKSVDNAVQRIRKKLARHLNLSDFS